MPPHVDRLSGRLIRRFPKALAPLIAGLAVVTTAPSTHAQMNWERRYGGDYNECALGIVEPQAERAFVVVGATNSYGPGSPDFDNPFIMKIDYRGSVLWFHTHGTEVPDAVYSVGETLTRTGYVMCGHRSLPPYHEVMLLIRTDPFGNLLWERTYGGDDYYGFATSVVPTKDGGFLLTGYMAEGGFPAYAMGCLLKVNGEGTVMWKQLFPWEFGGSGSRVIQTRDGGFVFAGTANLGGTLQEEYFVIWMDETGLPIRTRYYGGDGPDQLVSIETTSTGYILVGDVTDYPPNHAWPRLISISRMGEVQWDRTLAAPFSQPVYGCAPTRDGGLILTGVTTEGGQSSDLFILKTDPQGEMSWRRRYGAGGGYTDVGYAVKQARDGGYVAVGFSASGGPGTSIYVVKTGSDGTLESTVEFDVGQRKPTPSLAVSPNPFRSTTAIPGREREPVILYDVGGRIVGRYDGARIGGDLLPGVYFLRLGDARYGPIRIVKTP